MDCPTIRSGDLVEVELDVEIFRMMQEGHGGWGDGMDKVRIVHVCRYISCVSDNVELSSIDS